MVVALFGKLKAIYCSEVAVFYVPKTFMVPKLVLPLIHSAAPKVNYGEGSPYTRWHLAFRKHIFISISILNLSLLFY